MIKSSQCKLLIPVYECCNPRVRILAVHSQHTFVSDNRCLRESLYHVHRRQQQKFPTNVRLLPNRPSRELIFVLHAHVFSLRLARLYFVDKFQGKLIGHSFQFSQHFLFRPLFIHCVCSVYKATCTLFERLGLCTLNPFSIFLLNQMNVKPNSTTSSFGLLR